MFGQFFPVGDQPGVAGVVLFGPVQICFAHGGGDSDKAASTNGIRSSVRKYKVHERCFIQPGHEGQLRADHGIHF